MCEYALFGGAVFAEQARHIVVTARQREGERRLAIVGARSRIGSTFQQQLDRRKAAILGALLERCESAMLARIHLSARVQQKLQHLH